jgi:hypothetical protein
MEQLASYYMVIPAKVWNTKINPQAILLYGHISVLSNKEGFCWSTNAYFEKALGISEATVSRCLATLETIGAIRRELIYAPGTKHVLQRKIYIIDDQVLSPVNTAGITDEPNLLSPVTMGAVITSDQDNSTSLNTINPINIKDNNKSLLGSLSSLDAYAEEEEQKFISLFKKVEEACLVHGLKIGNRESALNSFHKIGDKVADGFMHRLKNDHTFKPTSLEDFLYDEEIDRMGQATL